MLRSSYSTNLEICRIKVVVNQCKSLGLSRALRMSVLRWDNKGGEKYRSTHCGYSILLGLGGLRTARSTS